MSSVALRPPSVDFVVCDLHDARNTGFLDSGCGFRFTFPSASVIFRFGSVATFGGLAANSSRMPQIRPITARGEPCIRNRDSLP